MNHVKPFLFRFKKEVISPSRAAINDDTEWYNDSLDMMMIFEDGKWVFAIDGQRERRTKKCDIEKGEDQKDNRMWR